PPRLRLVRSAAPTGPPPTSPPLPARAPAAPRPGPCRLRSPPRCAVAPPSLLPPLNHTLHHTPEGLAPAGSPDSAASQGSAILQAHRGHPLAGVVPCWRGGGGA